MQSDLLLIIPAFNESKNIVDVVGKIVNETEYDYIIVNDGSYDNTSQICDKNDFDYVDYPINLGLTSAFRGGIYYALRRNYKYAIQYDGDGQHDSAFISSMLRIAEETDADIVIGSRYLNKKKGSSFRVLGSRILSFCIFLTTAKRITDPTSGMRLYNRRIMEILSNRKTFGPEPDTIAHLIRNGFKVVEAPVEMKERKSGSSYLNITNSIKYMLHMCFSILVVELFRLKEK